jgi:uncharacterized protein YegJ (DUF2314 family)
MVSYSVNQSGLGWMTTNGMSKFGLPDLQIKDCPPDLHERLAWVMNATARYLLAAQAEQSRGRSQPPKELQIGPEIRLKVHELRGLPGEDTLEFKTGARGLTRIRVRYDPPKGNMDPFLTILPPRRSEGDQGIWLNRVLDELFGSEDPICYMGSDSQAMAAAHERAIRELAAVKRRFQAGLPPGETLLVKYGFPAQAGHEYMWIAVNTWTGRHLKGQLSNDPQMRLDLRAGQTVKISESDVFDWMLQLPDGRSQGNFTKAVLEREGQPNE